MQQNFYGKHDPVLGHCDRKKKDFFYLCFNGISCISSYTALPLVLSLGYWEDSGSLFCTSIHQVFMYIGIRSPRAFSHQALQLQLAVPPCMSVGCFNPLVVFVALCWICSRKSMSALYGETQACTQHSRCGLTRAAQTARIASLGLLATLPNTAQAAASLHCHRGTFLAHGQLAAHQYF